MSAGDAVFDLGAGALRGFAAAALAFLVLPIAIIVPLSFTSGVELVYPVPGFSLRWYDDFATRPEWLLSIKNSLIVGTGTAILSAALGTLAAVGLARLPRRLEAFMSGLMILPMVVPVVIIGVACFFFYAWLGIVGSYAGLILAHTTMAIPFVLIAVRSSLSGISSDYARAAASLGAPPHRVFARVTVPLILPGILSGALFGFAVSFDDVVVAMFLSGPQQITLPRQMFNGVRENISPTILAAATIMVAFSMALMGVTNALAARARRLRSLADVSV